MGCKQSSTRAIAFGEEAADQAKQTAVTPEHDAPQDDIKTTSTSFLASSQLLGRGAVADVYLGVMIVTQRRADGATIDKKFPVAVKQVSIADDDDGRKLQSLRAEFDALLKLNACPYVVRVLHFDGVPGSTSQARIFMEYVKGGTLSQLQRSALGKVLPEKAVRAYMRDVLCGLAYLHERGMVHRDVKPQNVLVSRRVEDVYGSAAPTALSAGCGPNLCKLSDFGCSKWATLTAGVCKTTMNVVGTAPYMSPECVKGKFSTASDIWAFAVSFAELCTPGGDVWKSRGTRDSFGLLMLIGMLTPPHHYPDLPADAVSDACLALLRRCLEFDYGNRPTARELLESPYFQCSM